MPQSTVSSIRLVPTPPTEHRRYSWAHRCGYTAVLGIFVSSAVTYWHRLGEFGPALSYLVAAVALGFGLVGYWLRRDGVRSSLRGLELFTIGCVAVLVTLLLRVSLEGAAVTLSLPRRTLFLMLPLFALTGGGMNLTRLVERRRLANLGCACAVLLFAVSLDNRLADEISYTITGAPRYAAGTQVYAALVALVIALLGRRPRLGLVPLGCLGVVSVLAAQRSAYLSLMSFAVAIAFGWWRKQRGRTAGGKPRLLEAAIMCLLVVPTLLATWIIAGPIAESVHDQLTRIPLSQDANAQFRFTAWRTQLNDLKASPVLGAGAGGAVIAVDETGSLVEVHSHNSPLTVLWRLGLPVGVVFLVILLLPPLRLLSAKDTSHARRALAALVLSGAILSLANVILEVPYAAAPLWLAYGLLLQLREPPE